MLARDGGLREDPHALVGVDLESGLSADRKRPAMVADHSVRFIAISYMLDQVRLSVALK